MIGTKKEINMEKLRPNNEWILQISKGANGYILTGRFGDSDIISQNVINIPDTEVGGLEAMQNLLWEVTEYFAVYYSKHNRKNLVIKIEKNKEL